MRFFFTCLRLQLQLLVKNIPLLAGMAVVLMLASALAATGAAAMLGSQRFSGVTLAVASQDEDARLDPVINTLGNIPEISAFVTVVQATTGEAVEMVEAGSAGAALLLPAGFLDGVGTGDEMTARLIIDSARPVESAFLAKMATSSIRMITAYQQGVRYALEVVDLAAADAVQMDAAAEGVGMSFFRWVLGSGSMFRSVVVDATGQLTLLQHYLLCFLLFFLLLSAPVLFRLLSLHAQHGWVRRLRSGGFSLPAYAAAQFSAFTLGVLLPFILLLTGVGIVGGKGAAVLLPQLAGGLLLSALFIAAVGYLCCNSGGIIAAVGLNFVCALVMLTLSGGLIPTAMLPAPLAALAPYIPFTWMRDSLSGLYGATINNNSAIFLLVACCGLFLLCLMRGAQIGRRHAA